jgi:hypothetical protein
MPMPLPFPDAVPHRCGRAARTGGLIVHRPGEPGRRDVERFISQIYAARYGADLQTFAPYLVSVRADGRIVAAAGYRPADEGPLFLERYLDGPVEALLPPGAAGPCGRAGIVEVGHLASGCAGEGPRLIRMLGLHLAALGFDWVVSTLTQELRALFLRLGVEPLTLGEADPSALGPEAARWGSYYDHRPTVLAGQIAPALRTIDRARPAQ